MKPKILINKIFEYIRFLCRTIKKLQVRFYDIIIRFINIGTKKQNKTEYCVG